MRYTAILDANVLYPMVLRDTLMSLAIEDFYRARWTAAIHDEWVRNLSAARPEIAQRLPHVVTLMNKAIPDCLVIDYEQLVPCIELPDAGDRHVLAAAIVGHADAIVTFNTKDFPAAVLDKYEIEAQHPDVFVMNQLHLHEIKALSAIKTMRTRWTNPPVTAEEMIGHMKKCGLPVTADYLQQAVRLL